MVTPSETDIAAIRALTDGYADAATRRAFAALERMWAKDWRWVLTSPRDRTAEGSDEVLALLRGLVGGLEF